MNHREFIAFVLYSRKRQLIERDWRERHGIVYKFHPEYRKACPSPNEHDHQAKWRPFRRSVPMDTLRICANISGNPDPRVVPEEIFAADIERCLNQSNWSAFFAHKTYCTRLLPAAIFPTTYIHNVNGMNFDGDLRPVGEEEIADILDRADFPAVVKPNTDSSGGKGVSFPATRDILLSTMRGRSNFVVQEKIRQHAFLERFNAHGINTLRVYTYRSVVTEEVAILNVALRMGKGGSLDNETAGGIVCYVGPNGLLSSYAVDKYAQKFLVHPDTGIRFSDAGQIPSFPEMAQLVRTLALRIPTSRLIGWDMVLDQNGSWRCIELNLEGNTMRFSQYAGHPFFGDFTDEIIEYCLSSPTLHKALHRIW